MDSAMRVPSSSWFSRLSTVAASIAWRRVLVDLMVKVAIEGGTQALADEMKRAAAIVTKSAVVVVVLIMVSVSWAVDLVNSCLFSISKTSNNSIL